MTQLVQLRVMESELVPLLAEVREHNPLPFDFVLKRHLGANGKRFPRNGFEIRAFFNRAQRPAGAP